MTMRFQNNLWKRLKKKNEETLFLDLVMAASLALSYW